MTAVETFTEIYRAGMWGGGSGSGSADEFAVPYCDFVLSFIAGHGIRSVVDLGCGDFRIGSRLAVFGGKYIGVDVVPSLIESLNRQFARDGVTFHCVDITASAPPSADLCLIRQVFQHLSNAEIMSALQHCRHYPKILITEHIPEDPHAIPNTDKPHGPDIRMYDGSGVFLDKPPFSLPVKTVLDVPYAEGEILRTVLLDTESPVADRSNL
jgi:SAM-dependent methyltransferase